MWDSCDAYLVFDNKWIAMLLDRHDTVVDKKLLYIECQVQFCYAQSAMDCIRVVLCSCSIHLES